MVFPTDERFFTSHPKTYVGAPSDCSQVSSSSNPTIPAVGLRRSNSGLARLEDTIPIRQHGTPLTEGHNKEVSAVSWTNSGELITVSDDLHVRCWREGPDAKDLRTGGEVEGRRWHCGWANANDDYNEDD